MGYFNPLLRLPSARKILALPDSPAKQLLEQLLRELRSEADAEAEHAWAKRKGPIAAYFRAVSTYARHCAHALSRATAKLGNDTGKLSGRSARRSSPPGGEVDAKAAAQRIAQLEAAIDMVLRDLADDGVLERQDIAAHALRNAREGRGLYDGLDFTVPGHLLGSSHRSPAAPKACALPA